MKTCKHPTCDKECRREVRGTIKYAPPIKSKKREKEDKVLAKIRMVKIQDDNTCKLQSPVCTGYFQGLHHIQKSTPSNRLAEDNLVSSCNACNNYVEEQLEWAKANGFFKSKFSK